MYKHAFAVWGRPIEGPRTAWGQTVRRGCLADAIPYKRRAILKRGEMRRRRILWVSLLAAPLVLAAADTLYWRIAVHHLEGGFAAWVATQRAAGWTVVHQAPGRGGWPLAATLSVPAISLSGGDPDLPGGLTWGADGLTLRVALLRPAVLEIAPSGRQRLRPGGNPEVPFAAERFTVVVPLQARPWPRFADVAVDRLRAASPTGGDATVESLRLHMDLRPDAPSGEAAVAFSLVSEGIGPPPAIARLLGPRIASLAVDGALNGPIPAGHNPGDWAAAWRDGGGSLELQHLALVWGPLDLTASATLALDEQLQPMGAGKARVVGYAETLDALAGHAVISRSAATAAKAVLSLLAHNPEDGSPPDVEVPLKLAVPHAVDAPGAAGAAAGGGLAMIRGCHSAQLKPWLGGATRLVSGHVHTDDQHAN